MEFVNNDEVAETPHELELHLKADRRIASAEIIEAVQEGASFMVVLVRPVFFTRWLCFTWKHFKTVTRDHFDLKVQKLLPEGVRAEVRLVI